VQFTKLKLSGFKSFVEPTELWIEPGMTGVVGPNGCGKSNLVEALRWVMGETSAKQMRGGGMEDVIFGGTDRRPPRNIAEVVLSLDNAERDAPPQYNTGDEIDVSRRIERGNGSNYRVNGNDVRARDVQTLFADAASGARSTALVSQGRIGALIAAKPTDRRHILEEAAGITGLHSRRHARAVAIRWNGRRYSPLHHSWCNCSSHCRMSRRSRLCQRHCPRSPRHLRHLALWPRLAHRCDVCWVWRTGTTHRRLCPNAQILRCSRGCCRWGIRFQNA